MSEAIFKIVEVVDLNDPAKIATFTRPNEELEIIWITIGTETVRCHAGTLQTVSAVLSDQKESHVRNN